MSYLIVTNNPKVNETFDNVLFTEETYENVLVRTRNLVHEGFELISHPLAASIRMLFSPYCSVIIGQKNSGINPFHVETIENSIIKYRRLTEQRNIDNINSEDYALIDIKLLENALNLFRST
ncbi:GrdX family protein [Clostridiaceae bacterium 35-E11]